MGLRDRATIAVYVVYGLQATAMAISWQFVTFFVKHELGASDFITLTVVYSAPAFINIGAVNLWGSFSDRVKARKPFMIVGFFGYAMTFLLYSLIQTSLQFLVVAMLGALLSSASLPVGQAHLTTKTDKKGERLGFFIAIQSAGWFAGALSSGFLYDIIGMFNLYRIAAIVCITATGLAAVFVHDLPIENDAAPYNIGFRTLLRKPVMSRLTLLVALSQIGMNAISFMFAVIIVDELGGLPVYVGLSNSIATLIAVVITGYVGRIVDRRGPAKILIVAMSSYVVFAFAFAIVTDPVAASVMWALPIYPLSSTAAYTLGSVVSGETERGRAMSLISGAQNSGSAFGPIVGGLFAQFVFGRVQPVAWVNMAFNLVALLLAISLLGVVGSVTRDMRSEE